MTGGIVAQPVRNRSLIWAALSATALLAVVLAVPAALYAVGGLPFSHLGLTQATRAVTSPQRYDPHLVAHWLARGGLLLAWISWVWMTVCVAIELRSWATGRSSMRLPASRTVQSIAACLVGTALAVSAMSRAGSVPRAFARATTSAAGPSIARVKVIDDLGTIQAEARWRGTPVRSTDAGRMPLDAWSGEGVTTYLGESGHPRANRSESAEAVERLRPPTVGVVVAGPLLTDGRNGTTHPDDAARERPFGANGLTRVAANSVRSENQLEQMVQLEQIGQEQIGQEQIDQRSNSPHLVLARETLWSIAADRLGSALRWKEIADLNYGVTQTDGDALTSEHWVRPGWHLILPGPTDDRRRHHTDLPGGRQGPVAHAVSPRSVLSSAPFLDEPLGALPGGPQIRGFTNTGNGTAYPNAHAEPGRGHQVPVMPVGGGIVGAGVVSLLERMRRAQQRHRDEGTYIRLPDRSEREFEQRLRIGDGLAITHEVDGSLRLLAQVLVASRSDVREVKGIKVHAEVIEVVMDGLDDIEHLPDPFTRAEDGGSILIDRAGIPRLMSANPEMKEINAPAPLLVTVGQDADAVVMVNLESLAHWSFMGTLQAARELRVHWHWNWRPHVGPVNLTSFSWGSDLSSNDSSESPPLSTCRHWSVGCATGESVEGHCWKPPDINRSPMPGRSKPRRHGTLWW